MGIVWTVLLSGIALGAWPDGSYQFRRTVELPEKVPAEAVALATIYTPSVETVHVRVASEEGRFVPSRLLMNGPGDQIHVAFAPVAGQRRYQVYFGDAASGSPKANELLNTAAVLLEIRQIGVKEAADSAAHLQTIFEQSKVVVGQTLLPTLSLGFNPFSEESKIIAKYSGSLMIPMDGAYTFAGSAGDKAGIFIDGQPILFVPGNTGDTRHHATVTLKKGKHAVVAYQYSISGDQRLGVVWKAPNEAQYSSIPESAFAPVVHAAAGILQQHDERLTADFKLEYVGEVFFHEHYAHQYRLIAVLGRNPTGSVKPSFTWDLGDGQSASTVSVDHVYLSDGVYPIRLSVKLGQSQDTQTTHVAVSRLRARLENPPTSSVEAAGAIVARYDFSTLPADQLPYAAMLLLRGKQWETLEECGKHLATKAPRVESVAVSALIGTADGLGANGRLDGAVKMLESTPVSSRLQPEIGIHLGEMLIYRKGDFAGALKVLSPFTESHKTNADMLRAEGQALVLSGKTEEGRKVFAAISPQGPEDRHAALTGALARTIEFYLAEKDQESASAAWEKWQAQYPADFLEGYNVYLKTQLLALEGHAGAAARVAEAFARAVPKSPYAPRLLDQASKLLAGENAVKSRELRETLKRTYPEDPLSQE